MCSRSPMDADDHHPSTTSSPPAIDIASTIPHKVDPVDDLSDSDLSQFQAEIEQNLSSASPESNLPQNGANEHNFTEPMDVDSDEEVRQSHVSRNKRTVTREYFDPELYGLRRSVSHVS
jgi:hypothetical protein